MKLQTIILAAGQGKRMRSSVPKVLHKIGGKALLAHVHDLAMQLGDNSVNVIYGHGGDQVRTTLGELKTEWTEQKEQLGTGHAVMQVSNWIDNASTVLILYGDVPLLKLETVTKLIEYADKGGMGLLTVSLDDPTGYGRIERNANGDVTSIVEEKDANLEQREIREVNTGILAVNGNRLLGWLNQLTNQNAQGEYYLTDIIALAVADSVTIETTQPADQNEVLGINNRLQLAQLERVYQMRQALTLMESGITLLDPSRFDLRGEIVSHGQDVEIDVNVLIEGQVKLGERVKIGPNVIIKDSHIGDDVEIFANSLIDRANIGAGSHIGPFARIRPESTLGEYVHIGNFVEIKKTTVGNSTKINHLSYIGDSIIGSNVNVGAGTITCNYDGANKHLTIIEDGAFIGSDTQLVAPVKIGRNATIGAGSTITKNAPDGQLTLSRSKQDSIPGWQRPVKKEV
ncbi:MAG: UDP-N-acetylglucosamine diphosphorylase/glucosamine-1-phosphate N-acetyltransferase [Candidatus Methylumidiphilus alinenensis]|uniref:Bifunctional protein GlmU n=1 Tax=Candidatus Methylumidiphilus alinenensis TaxID=2202197 RepID=A0A2W4SBA3_9GAMM|nr:MAG: UDP-N-acetylglucosamine diphosphorylase/glucosamine-1-phosphate N-acetyltransferase [Candidatus Methylumidiphilus alinenensis]